ncbi:immunity 52 family protein [Burkholderia stagnalis]|uniref:immunity 52 family protein n=1 Tax=Burkholderia stagnalis TaxID=1503054 RepID=UPI00075F909F|nr:immunity 52 family protein [Burkholderia stagnalis]KWK02447.1 LysR family transcriptional regulator [Burkholderia stagnalis]KWO22666.1 LysR family transcriptional regulator [Burkholderia stagnalis]
MNITALFRDPSLPSSDFRATLARESKIVGALIATSPAMQFENWRLKGASIEEATLYPAFESDGTPTTAAIAVLTEEASGRKRGISSTSIWNGSTQPNEGASMSCHITDAKILPDRFAMRLGNPACYATVDELASVIQTIVETFGANSIEAAPNGYFEKQVFNDKPGVGWMLYLPKVITQQQVPEARALIPVPADGKQTGTIIVSVTDAPFSIDNPEHVEAANRIEIRLVDQDLLPRYADI